MKRFQDLAPTPTLGDSGVGGGAIATFALTPLQSNPEVPINYTSSIGINIFTSANQALPDMFDRKSKFVNLLK